MAKKKTAAPPARATAKKPAAPARATAREQELRGALLRIVTRQLECARLGLIGAPEYRMAFSDDLQVARHFCERLKILNPLPFLVEDLEIEGISSVWIVPAPPRLFQSATLFNAPSQHFDPTDPNTLRAVNLLAKHTLAEFLEDFKAEPKRVDLKVPEEYMTAHYFEPLIESATLRKWASNGDIKPKKINGRNHYPDRRAFELDGRYPYELCRTVCDNKHRDALGVK